MKFKTPKNEVLPEAETKSRNDQFTFLFSQNISEHYVIPSIETTIKYDIHSSLTLNHQKKIHIKVFM